MDKMTLYFYGACLAAILAITTFLFSVILVPAWNWVSTVPAAISSSVSGMFASNSATPKPSPNNRQQVVAPTTANTPDISAEKTPNPANCGQIVKQIKAGKAVSLPQECEQTYQAVKDREQVKVEEQRQKEESRQRDLDRQKQDTETARQQEQERQQALNRQQEQDRQRQEAEASRAAGLERERLQREADERRRKEDREEAARREARAAGEQRERVRQQEAQKRNEAIINLGESIKKVFKKKG